MNKFNKNDFVKSTIDPIKTVGLIIKAANMPLSIKVNTKPIMQGVVAGYMLRLANGESKWAAEDDLKLISAAPTNDF